MQRTPEKRKENWQILYTWLKCQSNLCLYMWRLLFCFKEDKKTKKAFELSCFDDPRIIIGLLTSSTFWIQSSGSDYYTVVRIKLSFNSYTIIYNQIMSSNYNYSCVRWFLMLACLTEELKTFETRDECCWFYLSILVRLLMIIIILRSASE